MRTTPLLPCLLNHKRGFLCPICCWTQKCIIFTLKTTSHCGQTLIFVLKIKSAIFAKKIGQKIGLAFFEPIMCDTFLFLFTFQGFLGLTNILPRYKAWEKKKEIWTLIAMSFSLLSSTKWRRFSSTKRKHHP